MTSNVFLKSLFSSLLFVLTACGNGAELDVKILSPSMVDSALDDPFQRVTTLQFRVFDADTKEIVQNVTASLSSSKVSLNDLPTGQPLKIRATGYASSEIVSWGESARFKLPEGRSSEVISTVITLRKVDTWSPVLYREGDVTGAAALNKQRAAHTATRLDDGRVLFIGGFQNTEAEPSYVASVELLDPASGQLYRMDAEQARRAHHSAIDLPGGLILVSGGESSIVQTSGATTLYTRDDNVMFDQTSLEWMTAPTLPLFTKARAHHRAGLFDKGTVQFYGGTSNASGTLSAPGDTLYQPDQRTFLDGSTAGRTGHAMAPLSNGYFQVVFGGKTSDGTLADKLLIFNSSGGSVQERSASARLHPAVLPYDMGVFAMGGFDTHDAPLVTTHYVPLLQSSDGSESTSLTSPRLSVARGQICAITLNNKAILAMGGRTSQGASTAVDLFNAAANGGLMAQVADPMSTARYLHTCTLLENGMVLVAGGIDASGKATNSLEIYTPKPIDYPEWD